jgi:hypothetical protein
LFLAVPDLEGHGKPGLLPGKHAFDVLERVGLVDQSGTVGGEVGRQKGTCRRDPVRQSGPRRSGTGGGGVGEQDIGEQGLRKRVLRQLIVSNQGLGERVLRRNVVGVHEVGIIVIRKPVVRERIERIERNGAFRECTERERILGNRLKRKYCVRENGARNRGGLQVATARRRCCQC